jgi:hypothetical protein
LCFGHYGKGEIELQSSEKTVILKIMLKSTNSNGNNARKFTTQAGLDSFVWSICGPIGREISVKKKRQRRVFPSEPPHLSYYWARCGVKYKNF